MPTRAQRRQQLFEIASAQGGYFTAAQARALGYDTSTITHHARTGRFERVSRGFYRLTEFPALPHEDVIAAWVKAGPELAVVSHDTALALYELAPSRSREIHLTVPWRQRPRHRPSLPAVRIHTTKESLRRDEVVQYVFDRYGAEHAAMIGAFLGWQKILVTIFVGTLSGSLVGLTLLLLKRKGRKDPIPFGPFLALGAVVSLFFGEGVIAWYWRLLRP